MDRGTLANRKAEVEAAFKRLQDQKDEIDAEQKRLQGEHRLLSDILNNVNEPAPVTTKPKRMRKVVEVDAET